VIGAGLSGLVSIKECLQHGFEVTCFEKSDTIGGAWNYRSDGSITVAKRTVSLTSKHMMAFSDFPMPDDYPTFLHHSYYIQYLMDYVYMICRDRELWCSSRKGWFGLPHDFLTETRFCNWLYDLRPRLATLLFEFMTNLKFDWDTVGKCENKKLISSKTHVLTDDL
uniref:Flavin-containing monooxygenase n=1 Tax=Romanomermis culicivorax TaxID=13658 RepID=A0A915JPW5_ROMCU